MDKEVCKYCDNTGFVSLIDDLNYEYSFKCICHIGQNKKKEIYTWNGKINQLINKQHFYLHQSHSDKIVATN